MGARTLEVDLVLGSGDLMAMTHAAECVSSLRNAYIYRTDICLKPAFNHIDHVDCQRIKTCLGLKIGPQPAVYSATVGHQPKGRGFFAYQVLQIIILCTLSAAAANTRIAIGSFELASEKLDSKLADLIAAKLSVAPEIELVERRELNKSLDEASLTLARLTKAKDAIHVGAMVRADEFVLGTTFPINGTNRHIVRLVDARSGAIRAINVFHDDSLEPLADKITSFVTTELKRPPQEKRDYLAIGVIQNLGVNNRFSDFPAQMRGSIAANLSGKVTVLERNVISFLADEVRMNMAGLTESRGGTNSQMRLAFWIVDGFYQSYEVAKPEVQLKLRVERVQGGSQSFMLQSEPNEQFLAKISQTIENALKQPSSIDTNAAAKQNEITALEERGRQLIDYQLLPLYLGQQVNVRSSLNSAKNTFDEAIKVYESILLLDPDNVAAKMHLAACLASCYNGKPPLVEDADRRAHIAGLYEEVSSSASPKDSLDAKACLAFLKAFESKMEGLKILRRFADETDDRNAKQALHAYAYTLLSWKIPDLPFEELVPHVRNRLFDYLSEVEARTNEPIVITFEDTFVILNGPKAFNVVVPELLQKFSKLKPYILLAGAAEQIETNSPVIGQFLESLSQCEEHPETVLQPSNYFTRLSTTLEDEKLARLQQISFNPYERSFEHGHYSTVVAMALARQRASEKGLAPPLTDHGKELLAKSHGFLGQWQKALDIYSTLPNISQQVQNECRQHLGLPLVSAPQSEWTNESDINKVKIAHGYMDRQDWTTAAAIMDSIGHRTVAIESPEPGKEISTELPALVANECRIRAGKRPVRDPMIFELGAPYIGFSREATRFDFQTEGEDVWIGIYSRIERFRGPMPMDASEPTEVHDVQRIVKCISTSLCVSPELIWFGTDGDGLFELDRKNGAVRHFTMKDGLLLDSISALCLKEKTLWIGYRRMDGGGVGTLDLQTHTFTARSANLRSDAGTHSEPFYKQGLIEQSNQAPRMAVAAITAGASTDMWFAVRDKGIQYYHGAEGAWTTSTEPFKFASIAVDTAHNQLLFASHDSFTPENEKSVQGGLGIYNYRENRTDWLRISQGLPANETTAVAVAGNIAWVGGRGFVAVIDIVQRKVLHIAYVSANNIKKIELGNRYAWIQVYNNPLGAWLKSDFANLKDGGGDIYEHENGGEAQTGIYRVERERVEL